MMGGNMAQLISLLVTGLKCVEPGHKGQLCEPAKNIDGESFYELLLRKMNEESIASELPRVRLPRDDEAGAPLAASHPITASLRQLSGLLVAMEKSSSENGIFSPSISNDNGGNAPVEYLFHSLLPENIDSAEPQLFPTQGVSPVAAEEIEGAVIRLVSPEQIFIPETAETAGTRITDMGATSSTIKASSLAATSSMTKASSATTTSSATTAPSLQANSSFLSPGDTLLDAQLFSPTGRPEAVSTNQPEALAMARPEALPMARPEASAMARPGIIVPVLTESLESGMNDTVLKNHSAAENPLPVIPPMEGTQQHMTAVSVQPVPALDVDVLVDQLVQGVRIAHTTDGTEMHVQLKPEFLGKLSIKISSDIHGLHMEIKAENEAVRQIMQDTLPNLQQRLAEKGIALNNLTLLADSNWTGRRRPEKALIPSPSGANVRQESTVAAMPERKMPARLSLIDYFA